MKETVKLAAGICGADETDETLIALVQAAESCLALRLREGVSPEDCGKAFPIAAAMWAAELYGDSRGSGGITGFTAGSVSVTMEGKGDRVTSSVENLLAPWLRDGGFSFRGVQPWSG